MQSQFQPYADHDLTIKNQPYYWGKIQIENRMTHASSFAGLVLSFSPTWTHLELFTQDDQGEWQKDVNGTFTSDHQKAYAPNKHGYITTVRIVGDGFKLDNLLL